jgi:hypothetical protein
MKGLTFKDFLKRVRCGFELETQKSGGVTYATRNRVTGFYGYEEHTAAYQKMLDTLQSGPVELDVDDDGSVSGFEIRTCGPKTVQQFEQAVRTAFKVRHVIDERCSFHIHMSISGQQIEHSSSTQLALIEYVIRHRLELPRSVRRRFANRSHLVRYAEIADWGPDEHTFVSFNSDYNTWEFRCFGNVKNADDAMVCLDIAARAMYSVWGQLIERSFDEYYDALANIRSRKFTARTKKKKKSKPQRRIAA